MTRNGERRQRRPRIELTSGAASPEEAAAISAAIEQFLAETTRAASDSGAPPSRWQRAALEDGVQSAVLPPRWGLSRG